jgi:hypothetical protein
MTLSSIRLRCSLFVLRDLHVNVDGNISVRNLQKYTYITYINVTVPFAVYTLAHRQGYDIAKEL